MHLCFFTPSLSNWRMNKRLNGAWAPNHVRYGVTREYWMFYSGQGFVAVIWFGSSLTPPLLSASCPSFSVFLCVAIRAYWRERWRGGAGAEWENHGTARKAWSSINHSILSGCNPGINTHIKLGNTALGSAPPPPTWGRMCEMVAKCGETWLNSARWGERPGFLANNSKSTVINLIYYY
jgi:hypothetical protein